VDTAAIKRKKGLADKVVDSAAISVRKVVADADAIKKRKASADAVADFAAISVRKVVADKVAAIKREKKPADAIVNSAVISIAKVDEDAAAIKQRKVFADANIYSAAIPVAIDTIAIKREKVANAVANSAPTPVSNVTETVATIEGEKLNAAVDFTAISVAKIAANATIKRRKAPADYGIFGDRTFADADVNALANMYERTTIPIMATDNEIINDKQGNIHRKNLIDSPIKDKYNLRNYVVSKIFIYFSYIYFFKFYINVFKKIFVKKK